MKKIFSLLVVALLMIGVVSCRSQEVKPKEEAAQEESELTSEEETQQSDGVVVGQTWTLSSLNPLDGGNPWSLTSQGISEAVFMQNEKGELVSRFVKEMEQIDELNWKLTLHDDVMFSDGSLVDANALSDALNTVMQKNELSNATAGKIIFTPTGDYTVDVKTERETKVLNSVLCEWTNIVFKDLGDENYVFTGPYVVDQLDPGVSVSLLPNEHYPNAESRPAITIKALKDVSAMKLAMESGELDMAFTVTPEVAKMLTDSGIEVKTIEAGYQYFAPMNLNGVLSDPALRQAINLAINRQDYIDVLMGGHLPTGIFASYNSFAGKVAVEYDIEKAKKILEDGGYTFNDKNTVEKDGKEVMINIVTYSSRPDLSVIMQVMAGQLQEIGIQANTNIVESIDTELHAGNFDLALYAQHTSPTGNPVFFFNQFLRTDGSKNFMGYSSQEFDSLLNKMSNLPLGKEMDELAVQAQEIIYKDLPILYIDDPQWHIAVSEKLKDYTPYCGDYYIINDQLNVK